MSVEDFFDLNEGDVKKAEEGFKIPAGWYLAQVTPNVSRDFDSGAISIEIEIISEKCKGKKITQRLFDPAKSDDPKNAEIARSKKILWASRLGLITENQTGRANFRWSDCCGKKFYVEIEIKPYPAKDKKSGVPTGEMKEASNIKFDGIYPIGSPKVPEDVRNVLNNGGHVPAVPKQVVSAAAPTAKNGIAPSQPSVSEGTKTELDKWDV